MASAAARSFIRDRRPHCPKCRMRMIARKPAADMFECLRCGYTGRTKPLGHAAAE